MFRNRRYKTPRANSGQSTVEYIVLVTAVIGAMILFLGPGGAFQKKAGNTVNTVTEGMTDKAEAIKGSHEEATFNAASVVNVDPTHSPFELGTGGTAQP